MSIEMYQAAAQAQLQTPAWLIEANQVLALSSTELQSLVQKELEENPALELEERTICPACGRAFQGSCCPHCLSLVPSSLPQAESTLGLDDTSSWLSDTERGGFEDEEFDPTLLLASRMSLGDQLRLALRTQLPEADSMLIDYHNDQVMIRAEVTRSIQSTEEGATRLDRVVERFYRSVALPGASVSEGASAVLEGDVLRITIPRAPAQPPHRLEVEGGTRSQVQES